MKISNIEECNRYKGKVFEKWSINIGKHELVDSADAYKDGDWQEIRCTCKQGVFSLREPTQKMKRLEILHMNLLFLNVVWC